MKTIIGLMLIMVAIGFAQKIDVDFGKLTAESVGADSLGTPIVTLGDGWITRFISGVYTQYLVSLSDNWGSLSFQSHPGWASNLFIVGGPAGTQHSINFVSISGDSIPASNASTFSSWKSWTLGWGTYAGVSWDYMDFKDSDNVTVLSLLSQNGGGTGADVSGDFTAGTIEADNGADATNFVIAVGDTITVVGGVIIKLVHP